MSRFGRINGLEASRLTVDGLRRIVESRGTPMRLHPGITMHKIPVEGSPGLLFVIGIVLMALISLPQARWFLALSVPAGLVIGIILRLTSRD